MCALLVWFHCHIQLWGPQSMSPWSPVTIFQCRRTPIHFVWWRRPLSASQQDITLHCLQLPQIRLICQLQRAGLNILTWLKHMCWEMCERGDNGQKISWRQGSLLPVKERVHKEHSVKEKGDGPPFAHKDCLVPFFHTQQAQQLTVCSNWMLQALNFAHQWSWICFSACWMKRVCGPSAE